MKKGVFKILVAVLFSASTCFAADMSTNSPGLNAEISNSIPFIFAFARETDFVQRLFVETNQLRADFEKKLCASLPSSGGKSNMIQFQQITLIFYRSTTNDLVVSDSRPGDLDEIIYSRKGILHAQVITNEIPLNQLRVLDVNMKEPVAEVDLFLGVSSLENPERQRFFRRSYRFVYRKDWKEE